MADNFEIGVPRTLDNTTRAAYVRSADDGWVGEATWEHPEGRLEVKGPFAEDPEGLDGGGEQYGAGQVVEARDNVTGSDRLTVISELATIAYNRYFDEVLSSEERG